ncbi:tetratricopeptide repeat-containing sulfotransferase family protein [Pseudoalteromonas fenneropenaei]|uniref:Tetratricopeptide repeat-containing sulfotransferase family protein n=1 Tax=Pseudoalteromonas fenneropenaei TaxID=1737459 RepID=A0ABV7CQ17_9GAMM
MATTFRLFYFIVRKKSAKSKMLLLQRANELLAENKLKEAEFMFKAVLKESPDNGSALFGLGRIAMRLKQYDHAIYFLKLACNHLPKMLEPLWALADAFTAVGSAVDTKTVLEYAISIAKHNAETHYYLGQFYLDHGFIKEATQTFRNGLSCPPGPVTAYMLFELSQLDTPAQLEKQLPLLHELVQQYENKPLRIVLYYALANSLHHIKDFKQAFDYYVLANQTQRELCQFHTAQMLPFFTDLKARCDSKFFTTNRDRVAATFTPVFIVGLPRMGSTLLEQMLIAHSQIGSLGENTIISDAIVPFLEQRVNKPFPLCLHDLSTSVLDHCRELYTDEIRRNRLDKPYIINKLPANFQNIGIIHKMFPDARFIHVTRERMANAWSVFSNFFAADEPYFCDANEFQQYADMVDDTLAHFKSCIPRNMFTVSYEDLVADPEKWLKQVLSFLDQRFEPECLEFYKGKRLVHTLSKAQVRKPISKRPITAWQAYEKPFKGLLTDYEQSKAQQNDHKLA